MSRIYQKLAKSSPSFTNATEPKLLRSNYLAHYLILFKLIAILFLVYLLNYEIYARLHWFLFKIQRNGAALIYITIWGISLIAILSIGFISSNKLRFFGVLLYLYLL